MSKEVLIPGYVKSFTCIADKCEDTCCQTWDVRLDRKCYTKLSSAMADDKHVVLFKKHIQKYSETEKSSYYAFIDMKADGYCPFLTESKSCQLHESYGIDVLSDVCALYPRVINRIDGAYEINGALSCPEMVRKAISLGLPEKFYGNSNMSTLPRQSSFTIQRELDLSRPDVYQQHFMQVREAMYEIIRSFPGDVILQLYGLANYTSRISVFYFNGCDEVRKNELTRTLNQVLKELPRFQEFINSIESDNVFTEGFITSLLQTNIAQSKNLKYKNLVNVALQCRDDIYDKHGVDSIFELNDELQKNINKAIDTLLPVYLANCIFREWYITLPNTFNFIFMIGARLAMIRYLARLYIRHQLVSNNKATFDQTMLEALLVEIIYLHARSVDHNIPYLQVVYQAMQEQDMFNMDILLPLIKCG